MRDSVKAYFFDFSVPFEGWVPFMYTDAEDYVTAGMGNLADPVSLALAMPWQNPDGTPADAATIEAQWQAVKNGPVNSSVNAGYLTTIRLTEDGIKAMVESKLAEIEVDMRAAFADWDNWPADAQLGALSMSWAMGSGFVKSFPQFVEAVNAGQFAKAAAPTITLPDGSTLDNPDGESLGRFKGVGIEKRLEAGDLLWYNAQTVASSNLFDPATLYYPGRPNVGGAVAKAGATLVFLAAVGTALWRPDLLARAWHIMKGGW